MGKEHISPHWLTPTVVWEHTDPTPFAVRVDPDRSLFLLLSLISGSVALWGEIGHDFALRGVATPWRGCKEREDDCRLYLQGIYRMVGLSEVVLLLGKTAPSGVLGVNEDLREIVKKLCEEYSPKTFAQTGKEFKYADFYGIGSEGVSSEVPWRTKGTPEQQETIQKQVVKALKEASLVQQPTQGEEDQDRRIQESVSSRDGEYRAVEVRLWEPKARGGSSVPGALVTGWSSPVAGVASFFEMKAAVEQQLPQCLCDPRSEDPSPPNFPIPAGERVYVDLEDALDEDWPDLGPPEELDERDLTDEERTAIYRGEIEKRGMDALGWYCGFHRFTEEVWGIYLHEKKIRVVADRLFSGDGLLKSEALKILTYAVYWHEFAHAKVESILTNLEILTREERYRPYQENVYKKAKGSATWREEAFCNHYSVVRVEKEFGPEASCRLKEFMSLQPAGYKHWRDFEDLTTQRLFASELADGVRRKKKSARPWPLEALLEEQRSMSEVREGDIPTRFAGAAKLAEHLFNVPGRREAIRALETSGFQARQGGKHPKWCHPDSGICVPIPTKDPLSRGVFKSFLRALDMDKNGYKEFRRSM